MLAIVPARGGSKRVVGKNKRLLAGLPLISWTLRACRGSKYVDEIVVSTDDPDIASISRAEGVSRVHQRSADLATDTSPTMDAVIDLLAWLEREGTVFDVIFLAQPTSPLRTRDHIDAALTVFSEKYPASIIGVTQSPHPREWLGAIGPDGDMVEFRSETRLDLASHSLPKSYLVNGAIYITSREILHRDRTFFTPDNLSAFFMAPRDSIDIDTEFDFEVAEYLLSTKNSSAR
ncbi:MAG: acylneuraminate cytidylyltransferase family protein [Gammaproteobacteria bacterium]